LSAPPPPVEVQPGIVLNYGRLNRVPNNSVEVGAEWPDDWYHSETGALWADVAHTGFKSLLLDVADSVADWRSKAFQVLTGESYTLQAWVKGEAVSGEFFITVRWWRDLAATNFISEDNIPIPLGSYPDWKLFEATFKAPAEAVAADVLFRCPTPSTGKVYADDLALLTDWVPQYRICLEQQPIPFNLTPNPVEIYSSACQYIYLGIQFYPLTVDLTVKAKDTAEVEVFDADHERFLLPRTEITGEQTFRISWDGGGVFEPRIIGAVESITLNFPVEKPKTVSPVELGTVETWKYSLLAFILGFTGGAGAGYGVGRRKRK
jgi:hypothetical protein